MTFMPKLTVQNAEIKTATVEVKTLTLSGKQVTLSVFKQIEDLNILDLDGALLGKPWGRVNYHPDPECKTGTAHTHVVWQLATELRRARVPLSSRHLRSSVFDTESADHYLAAALLDHLDHGSSSFDEWSTPSNDPRDPQGIPNSLSRTKWSESDVILRPTPMNGLRISGEVSQAQWWAFDALHGEPSEQEIQAIRARVNPYGISLPDAITAMKEAVAREVLRRQENDRLHAQLLALPQLFIAI